MWTKKFWKDCAERVISTFIETALATIPTSAAMMGEVDWKVVLSTSALASLISFGKCVLKALNNKDGGVNE